MNTATYIITPKRDLQIREQQRIRWLTRMLTKLMIMIRKRKKETHCSDGMTRVSSWPGGSS